jgi:hypothetical protein
MFSLKQKFVTFALIALMSAALLCTSFSYVSGQGSLGFYVIQVVEQGDIYSITSGTVGQAVTAQGVIPTAHGRYLVYFGDILVDNGTASGYYVASNFTIPDVVAGTYEIRFTDATYNMNTTDNVRFTVKAAYTANVIAPAAPEQLQAGDNVVLNVSITGGVPNTTQTANITIMQPAPLNATYTQIVTLTTSSSGSAHTQLTFPSSSFSPSGSSSIYAGTYTVYFNQSQNLGQSTFTLGITDKTEYHRDEVITINAVGYQAGQTAILTIKNNVTTLLTQTLSASSQGIIHTTWAIPSTAALGSYNITITPQGEAKAVIDTQKFELLGYPVTFIALNLAGDAVSDIVIQVHDAHNDLFYNATTFITGSAVINLEAGTYTVSAYWNDVKVGERQISLTGASSFDVTCKLTNLIVTVLADQTSNQATIPYVDLNITIKYGTAASQTISVTGQTDISGAYTLPSTLPDAQYTITASKYGATFNSGNNTINRLPEQESYHVTVICPTRSLSLKTVDSNYNSLPNVRVELVEQGSGIFYSATTDSSGTAQFQVIFGQYLTKVYTSDNALLNQTVLNVFSDTQSQIRCSLYDLKLTVKIVDYFGNPMSNVNVQISRSGTAVSTKVTQNDGVVTFEGIVGGNYVVTAYLSDNDSSHVSTNVEVTSISTVQLSMANFVYLGGLVMGLSVFSTIIILVIIILLLAAIVVYKKTGHKLQRKK